MIVFVLVYGQNLIILIMIKKIFIILLLNLLLEKEKNLTYELPDGYDIENVKLISLSQDQRIFIIFLLLSIKSGLPLIL